MPEDAHQKLLRVTAGYVLTQADRTAKRIRDAASPILAQVGLDTRDSSRAHALQAIVATGNALAAALTVALVLGSGDARTLAAKRLGAELSRIGFAPIESTRPLVLGAQLERRAEDVARATIAADSLASQWRGLALVTSRAGKPLSKTAALLRSRVERTATAETLVAYNDEHQARLLDLVRYGELDPSLVQREWSALADACDRCWPHHGERIGVEDDFLGGDEPGAMHPHCRCTEVLVAA